MRAAVIRCVDDDQNLISLDKFDARYLADTVVRPVQKKRHDFRKRDSE